MNNITMIATLVAEIGVLLSVITPIIKKMNKISEGTKCQLRRDMLGTYYHHKDEEKIRQYEYENFVYCYEAYKALNGNSFIDKIYKEVMSWEVIS